LIKLKSDVILNDEIRNVRTICLPVCPEQFIENRKFENEFDKTVAIAGWGKTENGSASDVLMGAHIPYLTNAECTTQYDEIKSKYKTLKANIQEFHMCAGGYNLTNTCSGDSGSPVMHPAQNSKGYTRFFQQGIHSSGLDCDRRIKSPAINARVSKYINWILDHLSD
jgi:gram-positive specific serine protease